MKKTLALILAAMMVAGTASVAFAAADDAYIDGDSKTYYWNKDVSAYIPIGTGEIEGEVKYGSKLAVEIQGSGDKKDVTANKVFTEWKTGANLVESADIQYKKVRTQEANEYYTPISDTYKFTYTLKEKYTDDSKAAGAKVEIEMDLSLGNTDIPADQLSDTLNNIYNAVKGKYTLMSDTDAKAVAKELCNRSMKGNSAKYEYQYVAVLTLKDSTSTKVGDLGGVIRFGRTATSAKDNYEVPVNLEIKNYAEDAGNEYDLVRVVCDKNDTNFVLDIEDDADITDIEFGKDGELALFTVNLAGQSDVNVGYSTKFNADIAAKYADANLDFINFTASPVFNRTGDLYIYADEDTFVYEVTADGLKEISKAEYDEDYGAWYIRTRKLTSYVVSDVELDLAASSSSEASSSETSSSNPSTGGTTGTGSNTNVKPNPNTGR